MKFEYRRHPVYLDWDSLDTTNSFDIQDVFAPLQKPMNFDPTENTRDRELICPLQVCNAFI